MNLYKKEKVQVHKSGNPKYTHLVVIIFCTYVSKMNTLVGNSELLMFRSHVAHNHDGEITTVDLFP